MEHAKDYMAVVTDQNQLVFVIRNQQKAPREPYLVYNGSKHALLHRTPNDTLLLDYLNDEVAYLLNYATEALIIEARFETNETVYDYVAPVVQTNKE
jgi:hypothetical protein